MVRVVDVRDVVLDDADGQAEAVEDGAHPLRVALGQVVVDGDDVDAAAGHGVERGGERSDEGLALAGPHLGDLALVQDHAADELDVEVAHAELALRLTSRAAAKTSGSASSSTPCRCSMSSFSRARRNLAAALGALVGRAPPRRLGRRGVLADLVAQLAIRSRISSSVSAFVLGFERIDFVDERLQDA